MALTPGTRLGVYEVIASIGVGGMGEVYRATDTTLGRQVAIKILPDAFAADPERLARFEREAKTLASLNHPHIAAIYAVEKSAGLLALVMELVEGDDLSQRISRGAIPLDEALPIAKQIAEALEAAHERGVIHRDLKPANIKVTSDGKVKVLDFGLAKALTTEGSSSNLSMSPTITSPAMMTGGGVILGTAAYMSPEQARGKPVDKRADIWAFGCVFYEMLTGKRTFDGEGVSDTIAAVLRAEPSWTALPSDTPNSVRRLLRRCLRKDLQKRLADIGTARLEIDEPFDEGTATPTALVVPPRPLWRRALPLLLTAAVAGVMTAFGVWSLRPSTPAAPITRFPLTLPEGQQFASTGRQVLAMSPDGSKMAYIANERLYLRSMGDLQTRPIEGAQTLAAGLAFSPDGQTIAFNSIAPGEQRTLKTIAVTGGVAFTVCPIEPAYDMSWGSDGIVLGQGSNGILRVSPRGGKPETLVSMKENELAHGPQILPGGEFVLFTLAKGVAIDRWDHAQIVVQSRKSGQRKTLIDGGSDARYVPTGHIVYAVGGVLFATPFDVRRMEVTGDSVPIVQGVKRSVGNTTLSGTVTGTAYFSFSNTGTLIYIPGSVSTTSARSNLILIDRKGITEQLKLTPDSYQAPRLSPDGKQIVVGTDDGKEATVWIYELSGTSPRRRLTFGSRDRFPIWSADGQRVTFQSDREGDLGIFWQRADGNSPAERLTKADEGTFHVPESWSPQGDRLLVSIVKSAGNALWTLSMPDKKLAAFGDVHSQQIPTDAVFSPDGRWVAYQSGRNSTHSLYVEPFPRTGTQYQISNGNAHHPLWSRDGKELFYVPERGEPAVVTVATEPSFSVGDPIQLPTLGAEAGPGFSRNYDVTPDGTRLLRVIDAGLPQSGTSSAPQIQVVLNWFEELKARVPTK